MRMSSLNLSILLTALVCTNLNADGKDNLIAKGEALFEAKCDFCHGSGLQKSGTTMLERRYKGTVPATWRDRTNLTPALIENFVRNQTRGMAPFRPTELTDDDMNALIAYLMRNNP